MKSIYSFLTARGFIDQTAGEDIEKFLHLPRKLYYGIDPTGPSIHLGNFIGLIALSFFQQYGHTPVILIGGATGLIGDPSGKDKERPLLAVEEVEENVRAIRKILERFLDFDHPTAKPIFVNNYDWYSQLNTIEFLRDVGKHYRIGTMLGKESVRTRVNSSEGMSFTEFTYQILQGYDFYHLHKNLGVSLQIGGSDQYGNITSGIELVRKIDQKSVYGLTYPLLTRSDGKKFGKSEKGALWLSEELTSPFELYQYLVRVPDADLLKMFRMLTLLSNQEIDLIEKSLSSPDYEENSAQKKLAATVTELVHGEKGLKKALDATKALMPGKVSFDEQNLALAQENMPHIDLPLSDIVGTSYADLMIKSGVLPSKGEVRRLIQNNGAYLNGEKVVDAHLILTEHHLLKGNFLVVSAGKKNSLLIRAVN